MPDLNQVQEMLDTAAETLERVPDILRSCGRALSYDPTCTGQASEVIGEASEVLSRCGLAVKSIATYLDSIGPCDNADGSDGQSPAGGVLGDKPLYKCTFLY